MAEAMLDYFRSRGAVRVRTIVDEKMDDIRRFFAALGFVPASLTPLVKTL